GYIKEITANEIGTAAMLLGAGREDKNSIIDLGVGIVLHKKIGDFVQAGESLLTIHSEKEDIEEIKKLLLNNIIISHAKVMELPLIHQTIEENSLIYKSREIGLLTIILIKLMIKITS